MRTVKVSKKGWVVIPADIRKYLKIKPGDELQVVAFPGMVSFAPKMDPYEAIRTGRGMLKGGPSLTKALEEERQKEWEREERKMGRLQPGEKRIPG